jgi:hypothetical protein
VTLKFGKTLEKGQTIYIPVARLSDKRHVVERVSADCNRGDRLQGPDTVSCRPGINVDLFPSTTMLVTAQATDLNAKHWDPREKQYVNGPVSSTSFVQIVGHHPDLNKNGVDDYIDILTKKSQDQNGDGVPDEVQRKR